MLSQKSFHQSIELKFSGTIEFEIHFIFSPTDMILGSCVFTNVCQNLKIRIRRHIAIWHATCFKVENGVFSISLITKYLSKTENLKWLVILLIMKRFISNSRTVYFRGTWIRNLKSEDGESKMPDNYYHLWKCSSFLKNTLQYELGTSRVYYHLIRLLPRPKSRFLTN